MSPGRFSSAAIKAAEGVVITSSRCSTSRKRSGSAGDWVIRGLVLERSRMGCAISNQLDTSGPDVEPASERTADARRSRASTSWCFPISAAFRHRAGRGVCPRARAWSPIVQPAQHGRALSVVCGTRRPPATLDDPAHGQARCNLAHPRPAVYDHWPAQTRHEHYCLIGRGRLRIPVTGATPKFSCREDMRG